MQESPRLRRLRSDLRAMETLRRESSIVDFKVPGAMHGGLPEVYLVRFRGRGLYKPDDGGDVRVRDEHDVTIKLGAAYPRMMPELQWRTPIFHPNISSSGVVCLGGYSTHWAPSLWLDELCTMLWDMVRYHNFDVDSPYNRAAAIWAKQQQRISFPVDHRTIRDRKQSVPGDVRSRPTARVAGTSAGGCLPSDDADLDHGDPFAPLAERSPGGQPSRHRENSSAPLEPEIFFLEPAGDEIVDAEVIDNDSTDRETSDARLIQWL